MSILDDIKAATATIDSLYARPQPSWCVMRQDQYDALKADAESDLTPERMLYRYDRSRVYASAAAVAGAPIGSFIGVPVVVRAVGADISDLAGTVVDMRGI